jgi:hypothetical protein
MSSTTVLSPPPLYLPEDGVGDLDYRLLSSISRDDNNKVHLHFPYPYISDADFTRPAFGYRLDAVESGSDVKALYRFQSRLDWSNQQNPAMFVVSSAGLAESDACLSNFVSSTGYHYCTPSSLECCDRFDCCGPIVETRIQGDYRRYTDADIDVLASDNVTGLRIRFSINSQLISKCHATFYYHTISMDRLDDSYYGPLVTAYTCRYRPNTSAGLQRVSNTIVSSNIFSKRIEPENWDHYDCRVIRISWPTFMPVQPSVGDCEIELPWIRVAPVTNRTGTVYIKDIHGVVVFS